MNTQTTLFTILHLEPKKACLKNLPVEMWDFMIRYLPSIIAIENSLFALKLLRANISSHENSNLSPNEQTVKDSNLSPNEQTVKFTACIEKNPLKDHPFKDQPISMTIAPQIYYSGNKEYEIKPCSFDYVSQNFDLFQKNTYEALTNLTLTDLLLPKNLKDCFENRKIRTFYLSHCSIGPNSDLDLSGAKTLEEFIFEFKDSFNTTISLPSAITTLKVVNHYSSSADCIGPLILGEECKSLTSIEIISPIHCSMKFHLSFVGVDFFQCHLLNAYSYLARGDFDFSTNESYDRNIILYYSALHPGKIRLLHSDTEMRVPVSDYSDASTIVTRMFDEKHKPFLGMSQNLAAVEQAPPNSSGQIGSN